MIKWKKEIRPVIKETLENNPVWRFPTIRSVFYYLSDALGLIPRTEKAYQKVDEHIVEMRKTGEIPFGRFVIKRGISSYQGLHSEDPEDLITNKFDYIMRMPKRYKLPYLFNQPQHLEIWVEKSGLLPTFEVLTKQWDVKIRAPEGYSPWEFANYVAGDIREFYEERKTEKTVILYFGDQDPSGVNIYEKVLEQFIHFKIDHEAHRVGVTPKQITDFGLPDSPKDAKTLQKVQRDPRLKKYLERYGWIVCELDSFVSLAPDAFKETLEKSIEPYIDKDSLKERDEINTEIKERLKAAIDPLKDDLEKLKQDIIKEYSGG